MEIDEFSDYAHTGPGVLTGRYLRSFWQPVYLVDDLAVGKAVPIRVMGEDFTLYRGSSGFHVIADLCAHRLTKLSTGWVEGDAIRCMYHGWKYGPDGRCVEQPAERKPFCDRVKIASYPTTTYLGLVFAYFGVGEPPPFERDEDLESRNLIWNTRWDFPCNYFQAVENFPDHSHVEFVHRDSAFSEGGLIGVPTMQHAETEYGLSTIGTREGVGVRLNHMIMPNSHIITVPPQPPGTNWIDLRVWVVPIDDGHHARYSAFMHNVSPEAAAQIRQRLKNHWANIVPPQQLAVEVLEGRMQREDVKASTTDYIQYQDALTQIGQGRIVDRTAEQLGASDRGISMVRRLYTRDMKAIHAGQPRKNWTVPNGLRGSAGVDS